MRSFAFLLILLAPAHALACAVCAGNNEESRVAFILTTAFLTVLPLLAIGGGVWWLAKRASEAELEHERGPAE